MICELCAGAHQTCDCEIGERYVQQCLDRPWPWNPPAVDTYYARLTWLCLNLRAMLAGENERSQTAHLLAD